MWSKNFSVIWLISWLVFAATPWVLMSLDPNYTISNKVSVFMADLRDRDFQNLTDNQNHSIWIGDSGATIDNCTAYPGPLQTGGIITLPPGVYAFTPPMPVKLPDGCYFVIWNSNDVNSAFYLKNGLVSINYPYGPFHEPTQQEYNAMLKTFLSETPKQQKEVYNLELNRNEVVYIWPEIAPLGYYHIPPEMPFILTASSNNVIKDCKWGNDGEEGFYVTGEHNTFEKER